MHWKTSAFVSIRCRMWGQLTLHARWLFFLGIQSLVPVAAASDASSDTESESLPEIIVTARKVEENIQRVPMSVQSLSSAFLDDADLTGLSELQFNVPGLVVNTHGGFGAGLSLRGVANQGGTSLSVAPHINGVYLGNSTLAVTRMFDLERIEVLSGPQGTLYGRNSTGGTINFITRSPQDEFSAELESAFGSFDTTRLQGYVNLPFDKSALRLSFVGSEGDGYIRNSVDDRTFAENDFRGIRGAALFQPDDKLRLNVMAQHVVDNGASGELWLPNPAYLPDPADIHLTRVTLADPAMRLETDNVSATLEYDAGFATLRSISGYARSEVNDKDDCAGLPFLAGCIREVSPGKHSQWSEELQLISSSDSSVDWLVGANYYKESGSTHFYLLVPTVDTNPQNNWFSTSDNSAIAIFGQATLHPDERWSMTGGLRINRDDSRVSEVGTGLVDNLSRVSGENAWNNASWRVGVTYAPTDELLVYGNVSTGSKNGGITADLLPSGEFDRFDPEELIAYEAGIKSRWLDRRLTLNGAAFYYAFNDMQVSTYIFADNEFLSVTDNAAKAKIYGIDAAGVFAASDRLTLSAGLVWLAKREFVDYRNELTGDTLSGNKLSRAPEWTTTMAVDYERPWKKLGNFSARLEYNYRSDYYFTKENDPLFSQGSFGILNVFLRFEPSNEKWYAFFSCRNLTDENYFTQVFLQSSPGYPDTYEAGFGLRF